MARAAGPARGNAPLIPGEPAAPIGRELDLEPESEAEEPDYVPASVE
jgi:hypothetical protein